MENAITIKGLCKDYSGLRAVGGISLEIRTGEFFGLLGPNGAGKTTTIAMLTGLTEPSAGQIMIEGVSLLAEPLEVKSRLGFVPQEFAFYPTLNAIDNLRFFGRLYGLGGARLQKRIQEVLEMAELADRARQTVATFSNGMMRLLNIAIGWLHEPRILILDEPTVGVDALSRRAIYQALERLNRQEVTVLYTTHYMEEAQRLCSRVAIMDQGHILNVDTPGRLISRFGEGLVRIECRAALSGGLLQQMSGLPFLEGLEGQGRRWILKTKQPEKTVRALMSLADLREAGVRSLSILEPNLESVFLRLTGRRLGKRAGESLSQMEPEK